MAPLDKVRGQSARTMDGKSFAAVLTDAKQAAPRNEQYYECWANRAYYKDGWVACSLQKRGAPIDMNRWTLHELASDFSESVDRAAEQPQRLAAMVEAFDAAAWANSVYPLDNRTRGQMHDVPPLRRELAEGPRTYRPGMQTVHRADILPLISDRSYAIPCRGTCVRRNRIQRREAGTRACDRRPVLPWRGRVVQYGPRAPAAAGLRRRNP